MRVIRFSLATPLLTLALLLSPGSAFGAENHPFLQAIKGGYEGACGVAFSGGLYVSDYYHDAVDLPSGKISPESESSGPCKIELDAVGDLYVNNWHENVVKYNSSELLPGHGTVIDSANPTGLAVQQSSGDLYVAHHTYISKYSAAGTLLEKIGTGELEEAYGVAVSEYPATAGDIYVPDATTHTVKVFGPAGNLTEEMNGAATPQGHFTYLRDAEIAVDNSPTSPSYGHLFVLDAIGHGESIHPEAVLDEFNAAGDYRGQITGFTDAEPSGVTIDPTPGVANGNLYITSGNSEGSQVFLYGPTAPARALQAAKEGAGDGTVTSSPRGITCGPACTAEFNEGQTVTLFANPDAHSTFAGWTVSGSEPCPGTEGASCTVSMATNVEVHANFTRPEQKNLTVSVNGEGTVKSEPVGISCPADCGEEFSVNRLVTLTAEPSSHQKLVSWSGCTVQANPEECRVTMSEAKAVSATFGPLSQLNLSVNLSGTGQGTVTSYPGGISCPGTCSSFFDEGQSVYLMAAPSPGSGFSGFSGGGCEGAARLCEVTMSSSPTEVRAQFTGAASGPASAAVVPLDPASSALHPPAVFILAATRITATGALLTLKAPQAGTLLLAGPGLRPVKRWLSGGTSLVRVALARRARRALFAHHHLRLRIAIGFLPASGGTSDATVATLRFRSPASKVEAHRRYR